VQVLVEVGPELVNLLVPGAKLVAAVGKALANKVGWMDRLEELAANIPDATLRNNFERSANSREWR
jgi:hypothetical protein